MFGEKVPYVFTGVGVNRYSKNLNNVGKKQVKHICFDNTPNNTYKHRQKYDELNIGFTSVGGHIWQKMFQKIVQDEAFLSSAPNTTLKDNPNISMHATKGQIFPIIKVGQDISTGLTSNIRRKMGILTKFRNVNSLTVNIFQHPTRFNENNGNWLLSLFFFLNYILSTF